MRAWAKRIQDQTRVIVVFLIGVGRGGLPTHYDYNPWLILPVGGLGSSDDTDMKTHPFMPCFYTTEIITRI